MGHAVHAIFEVLARRLCALRRLQLIDMGDTRKFMRVRGTVCAASCVPGRADGSGAVRPGPDATVCDVRYGSAGGERWGAPGLLWLICRAVREVSGLESSRGSGGDGEERRSGVEGGWVNGVGADE